jgi:hypothetical protein
MRVPRRSRGTSLLQAFFLPLVSRDFCGLLKAVRIVFVPALMELFGRANWWIPRWLDWRLPRNDVERHSVTVGGT